jgi:5S rRNA maturation endonuclease (ribonuclease M5)
MKNKSIIFIVNGKNDKTDKMGIGDCCNFFIFTKNLKLNKQDEMFRQDKKENLKIESFPSDAL